MNTHNPKYTLQPVDTSLLQNLGFVSFIAQAPSPSVIYSPAKAAAIAQQVQAVVASVAGPWLKSFEPSVAVKTANNPDTLEAIFKSRFTPDVATANEVRLSLFASRGVCPPHTMGHSNMWVGEPEVYELVELGVRNFVVDKENTVDWILAAAASHKVDLAEFRILIRIMLDNPDSKGGQGQKFGLPISRLRDMAEYIQTFQITAAGVAFHLGTSNSYEYMAPQMFGMNIPPSPYELFDNYANAIKMMAPICNQLFQEGLIAGMVNTEGGLRPSYNMEYAWEDVLKSQAGAFATYFNYPVRWVIEPGRLFGAAAVAKVQITNRDLKPRAQSPYPYVAFNGGLYVGFHDYQWECPLIVSLEDVKAGRIYTPLTHPQEFEPVILVDEICAGSGQMGVRSGREYTLIPRNLQPGDSMLLLPAGAYTAGLSPYAYQQMAGMMAGMPAFYGFNGVQWPDVLVYPQSTF